MEHIIKQLKKGAKHTRLSSAEKAEMKSVLLRHVEASPVRNEIFARQQFVMGYKSILSPFQINNLRNRKTMPILVILGLLMGGSASFAAENALPGEVLFPVKVHVNETVRGTFAVTPKAKAQWEVRLVERRLEEVEELATKTDVSEEARQIASANLGEYTERVHGRIAKFEEDDDSDDAILTAGEFAEMLRTHEGVLAGLSTQVAGAVATSTEVVMATTTSPLVAATSTTAMEVSATNTQSLESILAQLREGRGHAEKKHKELKRKYHREDDDEDKDDEEDGDDDDIMSSNWTPIPVTGTAVGTTTSATVGTSTATVQTVVPTILPASRKSVSDRKEREERHEEVRATVGSTPIISATGGATTTQANIAPTEHTERSADSDSSDSKDDNDND